MALDWPTHLRAAWQRDVPAIEELTDGVRGVCVAGMGGSAIGGSLVRALLGPHLSVPVELVRDYQLPGWVGSDWLLVAVSYSGNTAETLTIFQAAVERGCRCLALTTGGKLKELARTNQAAVIEVPTGFQPRAALPYLLAPLLRLMLTLCHPDPSLDVERTCETLKDRTEILLEATKLVDAFEGGLVVTYVWEPWAPVAYRWQTQLNENAKVLAFHHTLPEGDHNDIVGWAGAHQGMVVVMLRNSLEPREVRSRFEMTRELAWEKGARQVVEVRARGEDALTQLLYLVQLGDVASIMLADRLGVEAEPVQVIESLKLELATLARSDEVEGMERTEETDEGATPTEREVGS